MGKYACWSDKEEDILRDYYSNLEKNFLQNLLPNRSWEAILTKGEKLGLTRKQRLKSIVDFSVIDTEEKAYILGFISADGCIHQAPHSSDIHYLVITLSRKDREILEKMRDYVCPRINIFDSDVEDKRYPGRLFQRSTLGVYDNNLCEQLALWGIHSRKTFDLKPPNNLSPHLLHHYTRGLFDGDGSITFDTQQKKIFCKLCGTREVMQFVMDNFSKYYSDHSNTVIRSKNCDLYHLSFGCRTAIAFVNYIYKDATIYLERKYNRAKTYLKGKNETLEHKIQNNYKSRYSYEEESFIKENYGKMTVASIARALNKSPKCISSKCLQLGLYGVKESFSDEEIQYIMKNYSVKNLHNISDYLGKSLRSIKFKVNHLKREGQWQKLNGV